MNAPRSLKQRREDREEQEANVMLVLRCVAFCVGMIIVLYQNFFETHDRLVLLAVAAGCMGPIVAPFVAQVFAAIPAPWGKG